MQVKIVKFGNGIKPDSVSKEAYGGKGANLVSMSSIEGVNVPPGFVIPCGTSVEFLKADVLGKAHIVKEMTSSLIDGMGHLEAAFGYVPLVSVRSGSRVSMPGMMDTILNVGLTSATFPMWKDKLGARAAYDCYRRFIQMYGSVVLGVEMELFEAELKMVKAKFKVTSDADLTVEALAVLVEQYKVLLDAHGAIIPDTAQEQITAATVAVFKSWNNARAKEYRKLNGYSDDWGTGVVIQAMVFGNMGDSSATGVVFTRNPSTGENEPSGEFLVNAQGEDVVAGIRTPVQISELYCWNSPVADELIDVLDSLELTYGDMQDVEFTVQEGVLFILQTRNGKRSAEAAFKIAHDMVEAGLITQAQALTRVTTKQFLALTKPKIDPEFKSLPNLTGIAAGGSVVSGVAVFSSADAVNCKEPCILVREETSPDDIAGMSAAVGILTATGGQTSHAAVVARGMNKTCVVGCLDLSVQSSKAYVTGGKSFVKGDKLTIDGSTGNVWVGIEVPVVAATYSAEAKKLIEWASEGKMTRFLFDPKRGMSQFGSVITDTDTVYLDMALIGVSASVQADMNQLKALLAHFPAGVKIIIDVATLSESFSEDDIMLATMTGLPLRTAGELVDELKMWLGSTKERVTVVAAEKYMKILAEDGFKVVKAATTVADLMSSDAVLVPPTMVSSVFGTQKAMDEVSALLATAGYKPKIVNPAYPYAIFEGA